MVRRRLCLGAVARLLPVGLACAAGNDHVWRRKDAACSSSCSTLNLSALLSCSRSCVGEPRYAYIE